MARMTAFDSPLLLGFDHFERMLDRLAKTGGDGYPPYNIEQIGQNGLRITLAVAGFTMDQLSVTLDDSQLTIRGKQVEDEPGRVFVHRGIAGRQFVRSFVLAEGIEVIDASLQGGLLHIDLERPVPESRQRTIRIKSGDAGAERGRILEGKAE